MSIKSKIFNSSKNGIYVINMFIKTGVQYFEAISVFSAAQWSKNHVKAMTSLFETQFVTFLIVVR